MKEFVALSHLRHAPGIGQRELGDRLMLDPNNTVLLVNEREVHDYAERGVDSLGDEVLQGLSAAERETLRGLLLKALQGVPIERRPRFAGICGNPAVNKL